MSFLEMLDVVNERLIEKGEEPIAFDHDCREGHLRLVRLMINGVAHGPIDGDGDVPAAHAQLHATATTICIEPWRARAFPVIKDLVVDRSALDRIIQAGGYISVHDRQRAGRERDPDPEGGRRRARWTPRRASAAARASPRARTRRRRCSPPRRSRTSACCRRASPSATGAR